MVGVRLYQRLADGTLELTASGETWRPLWEPIEEIAPR
jgi:hypothetical protein